MNSDIAIVGAGPIGLFSALQAAKLDAQVIVFEEHSSIGAPAHCTGHISISGLNRICLSFPANVIENKIRAVNFYSPSGYRFSVRFGSPVTYVINRELLDKYIGRMAIEQGAEILYNTHVNSLIIEDNSVVGVVVKRKKKTENVLSKVVIDAEGVSSHLLKQAGLPHLDRSMTVNGVQTEADKIHDIDNDTVEVFLSRSFAPGFFAWIVPRRDGTAKVGLATEKGSPRDCLCHFLRTSIVQKRLKGSHFTNTVYHPITLGGPISRTFQNGLLVVGDAASQVKSTTGGGVIMGLTCASIAGEVAAHAAQSQNSSAKVLSTYEYKWKKKIGFDMVAMKWLRLMLNKLSNKQLDQFITLCTRLRLDESLKGAADIDFQGTALIRLAKSPRTLATALYLLMTSFL
ncbi:MAG: NAD(P)/FAD-dependent oxidoreductase [Candidatus Bathyarchaeota archaeon]|nr:MAG: NAD(P)/FAD-dependent oxidoreductase [Candidatus Bathyarchaeota archaeon]